MENGIQKITKSSDCIVFGVELPNCEGKAGMAVVTCPVDGLHQFDVANFPSVLQRFLPLYAVPIFLRIATKFIHQIHLNCQKQTFKKMFLILI